MKGIEKLTLCPTLTAEHQAVLDDVDLIWLSLPSPLDDGFLSGHCGNSQIDHVDQS